MDYALAEELKEAGFKQTGKGEYYYKEEEIVLDGQYPEDEPIYLPTLEELIEACKKDGTPLLFQSDNKWYAATWGGNFFGDFYIDDTLDNLNRGETPAEAVARLWLALNKKL